MDENNRAVERLCHFKDDKPLKGESVEEFFVLQFTLAKVMNFHQVNSDM